MKYYDVTGETGEQLVEKAHPGGGTYTELTHSKTDENLVETIVEQQKKDLEVARSIPKGTYASLRDLYNTLAKMGHKNKLGVLNDIIASVATPDEVIEYTLVSLADNLDSLGYRKSSNIVDYIIKKNADAASESAYAEKNSQVAKQFYTSFVNALPPMGVKSDQVKKDLAMYQEDFFKMYRRAQRHAGTFPRMRGALNQAMADVSGDMTELSNLKRALSPAAAPQAPSAAPGVAGAGADKLDNLGYRKSSSIVDYMLEKTAQEPYVDPGIAEYGGSWPTRPVGRTGPTGTSEPIETGREYESTGIAGDIREPIPPLLNPKQKRQNKWRKIYNKSLRNIPAEIRRKEGLRFLQRGNLGDRVYWAAIQKVRSSGAKTLSEFVQRMIAKYRPKPKQEPLSSQVMSQIKDAMESKRLNVERNMPTMVQSVTKYMSGGDSPRVAITRAIDDVTKQMFLG